MCERSVAKKLEGSGDSFWRILGESGLAGNSAIRRKEGGAQPGVCLFAGAERKHMVLTTGEEQPQLSTVGRERAAAVDRREDRKKGESEHRTTLGHLALRWLTVGPAGMRRTALLERVC